MKISAIQSVIHWENSELNLSMYERIIRNIQTTDLILLPEMFTTGFSMHPEDIAEAMDGKTIQWMKEIALQKNASIAGSIIIEENGQYFNRLVWVKPDGSLFQYDKKHLFSLAGEHESYKAGQEQCIVSVGPIKCCPLICYDLRFPVWSRNTANYDVLIYVANWPKTRSDQWVALLRARAIENQCYVIGLNRVGKDANDLEYIGQSCVYDFKGNLLNTPSDKEEIIHTEINQQAMLDYRLRFNFLNDMGKFQILE